MTTDVLSEAEKMRRVPGIYFADTPAGRVATIGGTGLGVWEIVKGHRAESWSLLSTRSAFHWLNARQFRAAFTPDAKKEASRDGAPVLALVDANKLCDWLQRLQLGVKTEVVPQTTVNPVWFGDLYV